MVAVETAQSIETSPVELTKSSIRLAHPGKGFQGQVIDGLVSYVLGFSAFYLSDFIVSRDFAVFAGFAIGIIWFLLSDALPNGQSIGKRLLNMQVIHKGSMSPCSILQSFLRNITFPLGAFDWVFIFFGSHRRLGDLIASTIVIKTDKSR